MRLTYDALDRLTMLERPGYSRTLYTYDESHRRISKTTYLLKEGDWVEEEHFHFLFFNKREIGSLDDQGTLSEFRVLGLGKGAELGASIALELNGKTFCPVHDHRGNITLLIDAKTHYPTDTYRYSAFGEETTFGSTLNPWRFASKRVDPESGFSFFGRRYYSPTVGRFLTPDPIGFADGPNLYAYVHNSPMVLVDPYGLTAYDPPSVTDPWGHHSSDSQSFQPSDFPSWNSSDFSHSENDASNPNPGISTGSNNYIDFWNNCNEGYYAPYKPVFRTFFPNEEWEKKTSAQKLCQYGGSAAFAVTTFFPLGKILGPVASFLERCPYIGRGLSWVARNVGTVYQHAKQAYQPFCGAKSSKNSSDAQSNKQGGVYVLRDKETGEVMRTGRTNDFERRRMEHWRDPTLRKYDFDPVHSTNSYPEQRGLEQNVHIDYKAPLDKISPISPNNPRRDEYMNAAEEFLRRNHEN